MKYSVFTVMLPEWTPEEAAPRLAAAGYEGVEWRVNLPPTKAIDSVPSAGRYWSANRCTIDVNSLPGAAASVREMTERAGLKLCALGTYTDASDYAEVRKVMEASAIMGCPMLRIGPPRFGDGDDYNALFSKAVEDFGKVEAAAKEFGVKATIEVHMNTITSSPSLAHRLASHFDPRYVGVILDAGNMVFEGYENYSLALQLLGPYLAHVHVKNYSWRKVGEKDGTAIWTAEPDTMWGGSADYRRLLGLLKGIGYSGYLSFEDFNEALPTTEKLTRNIEYMRRLEASL